jgi:hypothetical protein
MLHSRIANVMNLTLLFTSGISSQNPFDRSTSYKELGISVVIIKIDSNRFDEIMNTSKATTADAFISNLTKPILHQVPPRTGSRGKIQMKPWMSPEPGFYPRMFVGAIVIYDQMQVQPG